MLWSLFIGTIGLFIWLLPFILVGASDRTTGKEKLAWLLAMFFISWFAWIFYLLVAPISSHPAGRYSRY